jgi:hypothetical protein
MTNMLGFTDSEWEVLESAPMLAGLVIGDLSDPKQWMTELYAVFNAAAQLQSTSDSILIRAVTERMLAREGDGIDLPVDLPESPPEARAYLIAGCLQAVRLVAQKTPDEVAPFKEWLLTLAHKAAESTKEGGFLGFGGERVSATGRRALHELETALDVTR